MVLISHVGNNWKSIVREFGLLFTRMILCVGECIQAVDRNNYFDEPGYYTDEMETSLVLYLSPALVLLKEEWESGIEKMNKIKAFTEEWAWTERPG
jgi:creatinine amidohydrolase